MKWRWYFIIPISVGILFLLIFTTTTIQLLDTENSQWNNAGFENLFDHYSASIKILSAAVITFTITFTIYRIDQTQQTLDNQDRQIKMGLSREIRDDFNQRLTKHDDDVTFFKSISFRFRDNYFKIHPEAQKGDRMINPSVESWLYDLRKNYEEVNPSLDENDFERYYFRSYSSPAKTIIDTFRSTFITNTSLIGPKYFEINSNKFLSDAKADLLYKTLIEIVNVAEVLNKYFLMKFYSSREIDQIKNCVRSLDEASNSCFRAMSTYNDSLPDFRRVLDEKSFNEFLKSNKFKILKQKPLGERRIISQRIRENQGEIGYADRIIEIVLSLDNEKI